MSTERVFSEELIEKLTCTQELNLCGMIRKLPVPKTSPIHRNATKPTLGPLDTLPLELLQLILSLLDFQSLSRLSRASLTAKATVEALPAYREFLEHAPDVLIALERTRILHYHSAALLRRTLRTNQCVSCFGFGAFLFLPTCERVCFQCLHENHALRVTTLELARKCFSLPTIHLKRIPILHSIPGSYSVLFHIWRPKEYRLVSVKQAKQLAIQVRGSAENVARLLPPTPPPDMPARDFWIFKRFHEAPLDPPACDLSQKPEKSNLAKDDFGGMASIRMPSLTGTSADRGRLCKGCRLVNELHSQGTLPTAVLENLVPQGIGPRRPLLALMNRLHSREGFLEHIKICYGAGRLMEGWENNRRENLVE